MDNSSISKFNLFLLKNKKIDKNIIINAGFKIASAICDEIKKSYTLRKELKSKLKL